MTTHVICNFELNEIFTKYLNFISICFYFYFYSYVILNCEKKDELKVDCEGEMDTRSISNFKDLQILIITFTYT